MLHCTSETKYQFHKIIFYNEWKQWEYAKMYQVKLLLNHTSLLTIFKLRYKVHIDLKFSEKSNRKFETDIGIYILARTIFTRTQTYVYIHIMYIHLLWIIVLSIDFYFSKNYMIKSRYIAGVPTSELTASGGTLNNRVSGFYIQLR